MFAGILIAIAFAIYQICRTLIDEEKEEKQQKLYIKQAKNTEDGICLLSFNSEYDPMNISGEDAQRFQCLGRMVWRGG